MVFLFVVVVVVIVNVVGIAVVAAGIVAGVFSFLLPNDTQHDTEYSSL